MYKEPMQDEEQHWWVFVPEIERKEDKENKQKDATGSKTLETHKKSNSENG